MAKYFYKKLPLLLHLPRWIIPFWLLHKIWTQPSFEKTIDIHPKNHHILMIQVVNNIVCFFIPKGTFHPNSISFLFLMESWNQLFVLITFTKNLKLICCKTKFNSNPISHNYTLFLCNINVLTSAHNSR